VSNGISKAAAKRPRRGYPEETRERLLDAAAQQFNRFGYRGTDSNAIAKEAGYATGTFYKHFHDKQEIFLAAYERWLDSAWREILEELPKEQSVDQTAKHLVAILIRYHTEWRGLRASLMELVFSDAETRAFFRKQRKRQLQALASLRERYGWPKQSTEEDAIFLWTTERVFDALGQGEVQTLGLARDAVIRSMIEKLRVFLGGI
jgi:AcrR family transcriptional regulator